MQQLAGRGKAKPAKGVPKKVVPIKEMSPNSQSLPRSTQEPLLPQGKSRFLLHRLL